MRRLTVIVMVSAALLLVAVRMRAGATERPQHDQAGGAAEQAAGAIGGEGEVECRYQLSGMLAAVQRSVEAMALWKGRGGFSLERVADRWQLTSTGSFVPSWRSFANVSGRFVHPRAIAQPCPLDSQVKT